MSDEHPPKRMPLPEWMRRHWTDAQRFMALCMVVGLLCGLAAVAFHFAIHHLFHWLWSAASAQGTMGFCAIMLLAPTLAGLIVGIIVRNYAPEAAGSGIPQVKAAYYNKGGKLSTSGGVWRFILGSIYTGLGNSLGREGPTVHLSAAISSRVGRWGFNDPARIQSMLPVGMAAGIAAAFNAPLSALTFVFEELLDNFSVKALGGMIVAVVIAAVCSRSILGEDPIITARMAEDYTTSAWMLVAIPLGAAAGLIGHFFVRSVLGLRGFFKRYDQILPSWIAPASGGLSCGIIGLTVFWLTGMMHTGLEEPVSGEVRSSVFSIGYDGLEAAFENNLTVYVLLALLIGKLIAVVVNYASGGSGGLFSPTLFFGGILGALAGVFLSGVHHWGEWIPQFPADAKVIGGCVLLGMGAMFAAVIRCPFTSLIIIFEMTGNYSLILPLMAGNLLAWSIARHLQPVSIYNSLLLQDGISLKKLPGYRGAQDYRGLPVQTIMTHQTYELDGAEYAAEALKEIRQEGKRFRAYPVMENGDELLGVVTLHELEEYKNDDSKRICEIIAGQDLLAVFPDSSIHDAANKMVARNLRQVPVVSPDNPKKMLGWLTLNDITRQQNSVEI